MTRTASCYTHKVQIVAAASNLKVEYPGKIALTPQALAATLPCYESFTPLSYVAAPKCPSYNPVCLQPFVPTPVEGYVWATEVGVERPAEGYATLLKARDVYEILINKIDFYGNDRSAFLLSMVVGGTLYLKSNFYDYAYLITLVADNGTYVGFAVTFISAGPGTGTTVPPNYAFSYLAPP